jgi:hypothetical protein
MTYIFILFMTELVLKKIKKKALENRRKSMIDKFKFKNKNTDGDHSHKIKRETRTYLHIREDMSINSVG